MFPSKELKRIARKKQAIVARNDLLRAECGEIWSAVDRRVSFVERGFGALRWVPPALSVLSAGAALYLRSRRGRPNKYLAPVLSIAAFALGERERRAREAPRPTSAEAPEV